MNNSVLPLALHSPNAMLNIRPVHRADVMPLRTACFPQESIFQIDLLVERAKRLYEQTRGGGFVVLDEAANIIGYGQVTLWFNIAEISDLAIGETHRGRGLGTALIQTLTNLAADLHAERIEIGASLKNPRALALYRRLGFRPSHLIAFPNEQIQYLTLNLTPFR